MNPNFWLHISCDFQDTSHTTHLDCLINEVNFLPSHVYLLNDWSAPEIWGAAPDIWSHQLHGADLGKSPVISHPRLKVPCKQQNHHLLFSHWHLRIQKAVNTILTGLEPHRYLRLGSYNAGHLSVPRSQVQKAQQLRETLPARLIKGKMRKEQPLC